ncbi:hypothetical protein BIY26_02080 [Brenneria goodwinii]|uniref:Uncharacterized protein n=1 Tax=Brenneria goodwinii TaxID=1109412 RepID=A0AAE8JPG5_9GAMM|nr:hypothetical protein AWC36_12525 [Brenneria goodwinii]RLM26077.1 hypothetical protein BIY28_00325 [Brenneria goodwinii]RLM28980.1 hypothetical protein BIY26_02080 [Brenneria goodwinii]
MEPLSLYLCIYPSSKGEKVYHKPRFRGKLPAIRQMIFLGNGPRGKRCAMDFTSRQAANPSAARQMKGYNIPGANDILTKDKDNQRQ